MSDKKTSRVDITHKPVDSSQVATIGYDPATKTLAMTFKHGAGAEYQYPGVTQEQYDALAGAKSIGKHFGQHIKTLPFEKFAPLPKADKAQAAA